MITIREVALEAGVSASSAASVLRGQARQRRIAPETQRRVEEAAKRLGYTHNSLARSLGSGKSNLIGVVGHTYPTYHVHRTREAVRVLIDSGYQITMQDLVWRPQEEAQLLRELLGLRVEGLYLESGASAARDDVDDEARSLLREQARRGLPIVRLDHQKGLPVDVVTVDREQGMYLATTHLLQMGHERIAYAIDDSPAPFIQSRLRGFRRALKDWGFAEDSVQFLRPNIVGEGLEDWGAQNLAGQRCMREALQMEVRPTALLTASDFIAIGAVSAALEAGLSVPGDISIVGFTDYPEAQLSAVPLTTVAFPFEAMASEAARMLLERIGGKKGKPRIVTLQPELMVRRSCGARADVTHRDLADNHVVDILKTSFEQFAPRKVATA